MHNNLTLIYQLFTKRKLKSRVVFCRLWLPVEHANVQLGQLHQLCGLIERCFRTFLWLLWLAHTGFRFLLRYIHVTRYLCIIMSKAFHMSIIRHQTNCPMGHSHCLCPGTCWRHLVFYVIIHANATRNFKLTFSRAFAESVLLYYNYNRSTIYIT